MPAEATRDPALRWYRGEPLAQTDEDVRANVASCRLLPGLALDLDAVLVEWEAAASACRPPRTGGTTATWSPRTC
ncbi:MAG: hypothetical protein R2734_10145 [Nocardioides sp.]